VKQDFYLVVGIGPQVNSEFGIYFMMLLKKNLLQWTNNDTEKTNFYVFIGEANGINIEEKAQEEFTKLWLKKKTTYEIGYGAIKNIAKIALDKIL